MLIDKIVLDINNNARLKIKRHDATKVYEHSSMEGGTFTVFSDNSGIVKIHQQIDLFYGKTSTTIYLEKGKTIYIVEKEENYKWLSEEKGYDRGAIQTVFEIKLYVSNWISIKSVKTGERNKSEGLCSTEDYTPLVDKAIELTAWTK